MLQLLALVATVRVVDLMPGLYTAESADTTEARVASFRTAVLDPNRAVFANTGVPLDDAHLGAYLDAVRGQLPAVRAMEQQLQQSIPSFTASFAAAFPKFRPQSVVIYLTPSMGDFDGMTQDIEGHRSLLLGVENIAAENPPLGVLIDHETFHVYHHDVNPTFFPTKSENDLYRYGVYRQLWAEGLATYVSQQLNPGTSEATALFSKKLATLPVDQTQQLACFVQQHFDSRSANDAALLFDGDQHPPGLPPRGGYLVGYLVAQDLGTTHSLADLADMSGSALEDAARSRVDALCEKGSLASRYLRVRRPALFLFDAFLAGARDLRRDV
jgi:hypothetical protein